MLDRLHARRPLQLALALAIGAGFGVLLQRGGATDYDVIVGQLLLRDFTVAKIVLSAVVTAMVGVHLLRALGLLRLHPKPGSLGSSGLGGLVFGVGFGVLGYCPGTAVGAAAAGSLDALVGGVLGTLVGAALFAVAWPHLSPTVMRWGDLGTRTLPELLGTSAWRVVFPLAALLLALLAWMELAGV
jgi:hypothetical protein